VPQAAALVEERTIVPRWDRITPRQAEFLAALSLLGGTATTRQLAQGLARPASDSTWVRDELLQEGDIFAPHRGQLTITDPHLPAFVLANYPDLQAEEDTAALPLEAIRQNLTLTHAKCDTEA
jgi:hypothetical protein